MIFKEITAISDCSCKKCKTIVELAVLQNRADLVKTQMANCRPCIQSQVLSTAYYSLFRLSTGERKEMRAWGQVLFFDLIGDKGSSWPDH
jgi:hypothetical protein